MGGFVAVVQVAGMINEPSAFRVALLGALGATTLLSLVRVCAELAVWWTR